MDAIASPFVEGELWERPVRVRVDTACACCGRPLHIETDGVARNDVAEPTSPLVFAPLVDFSRWTEPTILDGF